MSKIVGMGANGGVEDVKATGNLKELKKENKALLAELARTQVELEKATAELARTQVELEKATAELAKAQGTQQKEA